MTHNETEILIKKYLNGETTTDEERLLALVVSREGVPDDWKIIAEMLGELTVDEALFDQMIAERRQKPCIIKLWPWLAAACVAALFIVFLDPPRGDDPIQPQTAKIETRKQVAEVKIEEPKVEGPRETVEKPVAPRKAKAKVKKTAGAPDPQEVTAGRGPIIVDESDIAPYDDPHMQFAEQAKTLRERGNRVIQRVSMNRLPSNNYQLNDL